MNINRHQVQSSQIASIGYDEESKTLEIEFKPFQKKGAKPDEQPKTSVYRYSDVSKETWDDFRSAKSIGTHFRSNIKGKFEYKKQ
jgi:hypothetical protein